MPFIYVTPMDCRIELPAGSRLTDIEFECPGVPLIPFGCRAGVCGACAVEVVDGYAHLGGISDRERTFLDKLGYAPERYRLACQSRLLGDVTVRVARAAR